jgi:hypothetical protein
MNSARPFRGRRRLAAWWLASVLTVAPAFSAAAQDSSCWTNPVDTPASAGFICIKLTEPLLLSLRNASFEDVEQAMGVPGRLGITGRLHFLSNYDNEQGAGSGELAVSFGPDNTVVDIDATVEGGNGGAVIVFTWTADGSYCSDFPDSSQRCDQ